MGATLHTTRRDSARRENDMKTNVGGIDRTLRIGAGAVRPGLGVAGIGAPWTFISIVPLATGLLGWCPAYSPFGIDTCALRGGR
jgi:hypothetical protein